MGFREFNYYCALQINPVKLGSIWFWDLLGPGKEREEGKLARL